MSENKKDEFQDTVNRDSPEDKLKDLIQWTKHVQKNTKHQACHNYCYASIYSTI